MARFGQRLRRCLANRQSHDKCERDSAKFGFHDESLCTSDTPRLYSRPRHVDLKGWTSVCPFRVMRRGPETLPSWRALRCTRLTTHAMSIPIITPDTPYYLV